MIDPQLNSSSTGQNDGGLIFRAIQMIAASPSESIQLANEMKTSVRKDHPNMSEEDVADLVGERLVARYARLAATSGAATSLTSVIPGLGTIIAVSGGAFADTAVSMKLQVDMCSCLAAAYGYDITRVDAQNLVYLVAFTGAVGNFATNKGAALAGRAAVTLIRRHLRGASLAMIKSMLQSIGVRFTRKALEKAAPAGIGVAISASVNYALTKYVGKTARVWFMNDRAEGGPSVTLDMSQQF